MEEVVMRAAFKKMMDERDKAEAERDAARAALLETRRLLLNPRVGQGKRIGQAVDFIDTICK